MVSDDDSKDYERAAAGSGELCACPCAVGRWTDGAVSGLALAEPGRHIDLSPALCHLASMPSRSAGNPYPSRLAPRHRRLVARAYPPPWFLANGPALAATLGDSAMAQGTA